MVTIFERAVLKVVLKRCRKLQPRSNLRHLFALIFIQKYLNEIKQFNWISSKIIIISAFLKF